MKKTVYSYLFSILLFSGLLLFQNCSQAFKFYQPDETVVSSESPNDDDGGNDDKEVFPLPITIEVKAVPGPGPTIR